MRKKTPNASLTIWEKIVWPKKTPYWLFWLVAPSIVYAIAVVGFFLLDEKIYFAAGACLSFLVFMIPTYIIYTSHRIKDAFLPLMHVLWRDPRDFEIWFKKNYARIYLLDSRLAIFVMAGLSSAAYATVISLGLPFSSNLANAFLLVLGLPLVVCGSHAGYILFDLMWTIRQVTTRRAAIPFGTTLYVETSNLYGFFLHSGVAVTISYTALVFGVWQSPYGLSLPIVLLL